MIQVDEEGNCSAGVLVGNLRELFRRSINVDIFGARVAGKGDLVDAMGRCAEAEPVFVAGRFNGSVYGHAVGVNGLGGGVVVAVIGVLRVKDLRQERCGKQCNDRE